MSDPNAGLIIAAVIAVKAAIVIGGAMIARSKGRSPIGWGFVCLFFSWIGLIIIICMPKVVTAAEVAAEVKVLDAGDLSTLDLSGSTKYQAANGVVISRLKDGRAVAKLGSDFKLFDTMEDYRVWSNDQSSWQEIRATA